MYSSAACQCTINTRMRHDLELQVHCMNRWELKLNAEDAFRYEDILDNFDALWDQANNLLLSDPTPRLLGKSPSRLLFC